MYFPFKSSKKRTNIDVGNEHIKDEFLGVIFEKSDENVKKSALIALKVYNHSFLGQIYPSLVLFIFYVWLFLRIWGIFSKASSGIFQFHERDPEEKIEKFQKWLFFDFLLENGPFWPLCGYLNGLKVHELVFFSQIYPSLDHLPYFIWNIRRKIRFFSPGHPTSRSERQVPTLLE